MKRHRIKRSLGEVPKISLLKYCYGDLSNGHLCQADAIRFCERPKLILNRFITVLNGHQKISSSHRRTNRGVGGCRPPQIRALSIFFGELQWLLYSYHKTKGTTTRQQISVLMGDNKNKNRKSSQIMRTRTGAMWPVRYLSRSACYFWLQTLQ